ncbi:chemotaxis protein CheD [Leptospira sp. WS92.C1]
MIEPDIVRDLFLQPGGFCWGQKNLRIRTLLGSCVSICFWNPTNFFGGMAHVMLPKRPPGEVNHYPNPKYADDAIQLFFDKIQETGGRYTQYQIKLFGGASMFSTEEEKLLEIKSVRDIGTKNIHSIQEIIKDHRLSITSEDLGGFSHRRVFFTLWNGEIYIERPKPS